MSEFTKTGFTFIEHNDEVVCFDAEDDRDKCFKWLTALSGADAPEYECIKCGIISETIFDMNNARRCKCGERAKGIMKPLKPDAPAPPSVSVEELEAKFGRLSTEYKQHSEWSVAESLKSYYRGQADAYNSAAFLIASATSTGEQLTQQQMEEDIDLGIGASLQPPDIPRADLRDAIHRAKELAECSEGKETAEFIGRQLLNDTAQEPKELVFNCCTKCNGSMSPSPEPGICDDCSQEPVAGPVVEIRQGGNELGKWCYRACCFRTNGPHRSKCTMGWGKLDAGVRRPGPLCPGPAPPGKEHRLTLIQIKPEVEVGEEATDDTE